MRLPLLLPLLLLATPARADRISLSPPGSEVGIRFYSLGLLPLDGNYTRFQGWLIYDPTDRTRCQVELSAEADSLALANASLRSEVVGPEFMDAARFPTVKFTGICQGRGLQGALTMRGITHAFRLALDWTRGSVTATGRMHRADWGMTTHPLLGGGTARIRITTTLPKASEP